MAHDRARLQLTITLTAPTAADHPVYLMITSKSGTRTHLSPVAVSSL